MNKQLIAWMLRPLWRLNGITLALGLLCVLMSKEPLFETWFPPAVFVALHTLLVTHVLGGGAAGPSTFLYTRGYSRDDLWRAATVAGWVSAAVVWLPCAAAVLTPMRSWVQVVLFANPFYPLMQPRDWVLPAWCLFLYILLLPTFQYSWIRAACPGAGANGGYWIAAATALCVVCWMNVPSQAIRESEWFSAAVLLVGSAVAVVLTRSSQKLHQTVETR